MGKIPKFFKNSGHYYCGDCAEKSGKEMYSVGTNVRFEVPLYCFNCGVHLKNRLGEYGKEKLESRVLYAMKKGRYGSKHLRVANFYSVFENILGQDSYETGEEFVKAKVLPLKGGTKLCRTVGMCVQIVDHNIESSYKSDDGFSIIKNANDDVDGFVYEKMFGDEFIILPEKGKLPVSFSTTQKRAMRLLNAIHEFNKEHSI